MSSLAPPSRPAPPRLLLRAVLAAALLLQAPRTAALQPLDLFVRSARDRNPDALEARAGVAQQEAQAQGALGRVLPGLSFQGSYLRNQYETSLAFGGQTVTLVPSDQLQGTAALRVPLVDLASLQGFAAARTAAAGAGHQLEAARLQVEAGVVQGYWQLVADLALVEAAQQALDVSREGLRVAEQRRLAGAAGTIDVDRARADVEQQVQQLAAARLQVAVAERALESASGVAPELAGPAPLDDDLHAEPGLGDFERGLDELPAVRAAGASSAAAEQQARAERLALLPTLAGAMTENLSNAPGFSGHEASWQASLNLSWSFDLTRVAAIRGQDAAADAARARALRARLAAGDAIHRQWNTVDAAIARSRSARVEKEAAEHASRLARDRYRAGDAPQLDVLQAQRDAFRAEVGRIQADADLVNARAQLRLAAALPREARP